MKRKMPGVTFIGMRPITDDINAKVMTILNLYPRESFIYDENDIKFFRRAVKDLLSVLKKYASVGQEDEVD